MNRRAFLLGAGASAAVPLVERSWVRRAYSFLWSRSEVVYIDTETVQPGDILYRTRWFVQDCEGNGEIIELADPKPRVTGPILIVSTDYLESCRRIR